MFHVICIEGYMKQYCDDSSHCVNTVLSNSKFILCLVELVLLLLLLLLLLQLLSLVYLTSLLFCDYSGLHQVLGGSPVFIVV